MTLDPNFQLLIANSRIAQAQAEAAGERLARGTVRSARIGRGATAQGATGAHGSIVRAVLAPVRRLTAVAMAVAARRHPAGKAA